MPYQIREFHILLSQLFQYENQKVSPLQIQQSFLDIYVFKLSSVCIGVKFRNIKLKKYGFKIKAVEIKIDRQALESNHIQQQKSTHFRYYQQWKKYELQFNYKLLSPSTFQDAQELQRIKHKEIDKTQSKNYSQTLKMKYESYESQLQHLNIELIQKIKNDLNKIISLKGQKYPKNVISSWFNTQNQIRELFVIHKNKYKSKSWESGKIIVQNFSGNIFQLKDHKEKIHQFKALVMETFSEEDKKSSFIELKIDSLALKKEFNKQLRQSTFDSIYNLTDQEQNLVQRHKNGYKYKYNTSYPQLLEDIYEFCTLKK